MHSPEDQTRGAARHRGETGAEASNRPRGTFHRSSGWARGRAAVITLAISLGLVDGCPIPTSSVMARLPPLLQTASLRLYDVQHIVLRPFALIKDAFSISQRWALFSRTGGTRYRMWIEASAAPSEPWTLLYRAGDGAHTFLHETLEYRRVRNVWNPSRRGAKRSYSAFCSWMARTVFLRELRFQRVRVGMERGEILARGTAFVPSGEFNDVMILRREDVLR